MLAAMNDVKLTLYQSSVVHGVPRSTSNYRLKTETDEFKADKKIAGWDWYSAFMERHPDISLRKSQSVSFARAQCMNRPQVDEFFNMLGVELDTLGLRQTPQAIYNMDESGLHLHFRPGKVLAAKR